MNRNIPPSNLSGNDVLQRRIVSVAAIPALLVIVTGLLFHGSAQAQLRVSSQNPRYFVQKSDTARAVYLAGSHVYAGFVDQGPNDPPPTFDYTGYLNFLAGNGHNFFRYWTSWMSPKDGPWNRDPNHENWYYGGPYPWRRTGPGNAEDGKPRFNFDSLDQAYFNRLHGRVDSAQRRGIYVSIMLFNAWDMGNQKGESPGNPGFHSPWRLVNNVNTINGDPDDDFSCEEVLSDTIPVIWEIEERYVKRVLDTVNEFDNVLFEICNEANGTPASLHWTNRVIDMIHDYERSKPKQHPVGFTVFYPNGSNDDLFQGNNAEWVSPNGVGGYESDPPTADTSKVIVNDTDHLCGLCGDRGYVWRSFMRGLNFLWMDSYDGMATGSGANWGYPGWDSSNSVWVSFRKNIGATVAYSNRMNLLYTRPNNSLSSTNYCLYGEQKWLVYQPWGGEFSVDLSSTQDSLEVEWMNLEDASIIQGEKIAGGDPNYPFTPPFSGDAVLFLYVNKPVRARIKALLEGPFDASTGFMGDPLNVNGTLASHFTGVLIPAQAVDSITIELRNDTSAAASIRKFAPAWLLTDGTIRSFSDTTKDYVEFDTTAGNYYLVVWHRNHLPVMTATAQYLDGTPSSAYDFTTALTKAYGFNSMKQIGSKFVMYGGDADSNLGIGASDIVSARAAVGVIGYTSDDVDMNGGVGASDLVVCRQNVGYFSQVPP